MSVSSCIIGSIRWRWLERPCQRCTSEWIDADRFFGGLEAYQQLRQQGQRVRLICTGGWLPTQPQLQPEGDVLSQRALELGIPTLYQA